MAYNFDGLLGEKGSFLQSSDISGVYDPYNVKNDFWRM